MLRQGFAWVVGVWAERQWRRGYLRRCGRTPKVVELPRPLTEAEGRALEVPPVLYSGLGPRPLFGVACEACEGGEHELPGRLAAGCHCPCHGGTL